MGTQQRAFVVIKDLNMKLYTYFRSSAAYRVRIALNLKDIAHEISAVNLLKSEQTGEEYTNKNSQGLLPALETEQGVLGQSLAILEWLEETYTDTPLLPNDPWQKAQIRNFCYAIACLLKKWGNWKEELINTFIEELAEASEPIETRDKDDNRHNFGTRAYKGNTPKGLPTLIKKMKYKLHLY